MMLSERLQLTIMALSASESLGVFVDDLGSLYVKKQSYQCTLTQ